MSGQKKIVKVIERWKKKLIRDSFAEDVLAFKYPYDKYWEKENNSTQPVIVYLTAVIIYYQKKILFIVDEDFLTYEMLHKSYRDIDDLYHFFESKLKTKWFSLITGFNLHPVYIDKPWGQEIWYTGIERRGVSFIKQGQRNILLPYVLSLFPNELANGNQTNIILLKILDPLPNPDIGDLYFELHEKKKEVYIVSKISKKCYPNGLGKMKLGINQKKYNHYLNKKEFKKSMLDIITKYKQTFDEVYKLVLMNYRHQTNQNAVPPNEYLKMLKKLPQNIQKQLKQQYEKVEEFCHFESLNVGDVVTVSSLVPHSLLHGVKVVEFQTPHYERKIISFNQKVVTQKEWDTKEAIACMDCSPQSKNLNLKSMEYSDNIEVEIIAIFQDFLVKRIYLHKLNTRYQEMHEKTYFLIICLEGEIKLIFKDQTEIVLAVDQAFFVSAVCKQFTVENKQEKSIYLKTIPKLK